MIILTIFIIMAVFGIIFWIVLLTSAVRTTAVQSKAKKLAVELGYEGYKDAVMRLGLVILKKHYEPEEHEIFSPASRRSRRTLAARPGADRERVALERVQAIGGAR